MERTDIRRDQIKFPANFGLPNFWTRSRVGRMNPRVSHQKTAALTLTEVLVVICIVVVLVLVILPAVDQDGSRKAPRINCLNNLQQIGLSYKVWAGDHNGKFPMQVSVANGGTMELTANGNNPWLNFLVMSNLLNTPKYLVCPSDKDRVVAQNFTNGFSAKNISYFVGLDADTNHPQMFLSGDDNFVIGGVPVKSGLLKLSTNTLIAWTTERHVNGDNIGLADGSISSVSNSQLANLILKTGVDTNSLAIP